MNEKVLFITHLDEKMNDEVQIIEEQTFDISDFYKKNLKSANKAFVLPVKNPKSFLKSLKKQITIIKAAGGLAQNDEGNFLFIFRNKKWDLPKGKLEKKEKNRIAAQRELEEECGVVVHKTLHKIANTYHLYIIDKEVVLKKTAWFKMHVKGNPTLIPQVEEGITKAKWLNEKEIQKTLKNTFPLIKDVLQKENLITIMD